MFVLSLQKPSPTKEILSQPETIKVENAYKDLLIANLHNFLHKRKYLKEVVHTGFLDLRIISLH